MIDPEAQSCVNAVIAAAEKLDHETLVACVTAMVCQHAGIDGSKIRLSPKMTVLATNGLMKLQAEVRTDQRRFNAGNN